MIDGWGISCEIALIWMSPDFIDDQSLVQVMAWCHQATSHYLSQGWPRSLSPYGVTRPQWVNTLRLRQNGRHFSDDISKCIFFNENVWILLKISAKFVLKVQINNIPSLVKIMTCGLVGLVPLSEPMMGSLPTHICVSRPQWIKLIGHRKMWKSFYIVFFKLILPDILSNSCKA